MSQFKIHDPVISRAILLRGVTMKEGFAGKVVQATLSGKNDIYYLVRDSSGDDWHRDTADLTVAP